MFDILALAYDGCQRSSAFGPPHLIQRGGHLCPRTALTTRLNARELLDESLVERGRVLNLRRVTKVWEWHQHRALDALVRPAPRLGVVAKVLGNLGRRAVFANGGGVLLADDQYGRYGDLVNLVNDR